MLLLITCRETLEGAFQLPNATDLHIFLGNFKKVVLRERALRSLSRTHPTPSPERAMHAGRASDLRRGASPTHC